MLRILAMTKSKRFYPRCSGTHVKPLLKKSGSQGIIGPILSGAEEREHVMSANIILRSKAWKYGDNIDTDGIIPARYLASSDPAYLAEHCMEDVDTGFVKKAQEGDFIVAGKNFGCGSSREHAPIAIKAAGISCVIAKSFARIFYRNAFNMGLPILDCPEAVDGINDGDEIEINLSEGLIKNLSTGAEFRASPIPPFMQELLDAGGLINYARDHIKKSAADAKQGKADE